MTQAMAASPAHFSSTCSQTNVSVMCLVTSAPCFLFLVTLKSLKVLRKLCLALQKLPRVTPQHPTTALTHSSLFSCSHPFPSSCHRAFPHSLRKCSAQLQFAMYLGDVFNGHMSLSLLNSKIAMGKRSSSCAYP